jgi:hypothetical protein
MDALHTLIERVSVNIEPLPDQLIQCGFGCLEPLGSGSLGEFIQFDGCRLDHRRQRLDQALPQIHLHLVDHGPERRTVSAQLAQSRQFANEVPQPVAVALTPNEIFFLRGRAADQRAQTVFALIVPAFLYVDRFAMCIIKMSAGGLPLQPAEIRAATQGIADGNSGVYSTLLSSRFVTCDMSGASPLRVIHSLHEAARDGMILRRAKLARYAGSTTALYDRIQTLCPTTVEPLVRFEGLPEEFSRHNGEVDVHSSSLTSPIKAHADSPSIKLMRSSRRSSSATTTSG